MKTCSINLSKQRNATCHIIPWKKYCNMNALTSALKTGLFILLLAFCTILLLLKIRRML